MNSNCDLPLSEPSENLSRTERRGPLHRLRRRGRLLWACAAFAFLWPVQSRAGGCEDLRSMTGTSGSCSPSGTSGGGSGSSDSSDSSGSSYHPPSEAQIQQSRLDRLEERKLLRGSGTPFFGLGGGIRSISDSVLRLFKDKADSNCGFDTPCQDAERPRLSASQLKKTIARIDDMRERFEKYRDRLREHQSALADAQNEDSPWAKPTSRSAAVRDLQAKVQEDKRELQSNRTRLQTLLEQPGVRESLPAQTARAAAMVTSYVLD